MGGYTYLYIILGVLIGGILVYVFATQKKRTYKNLLRRVQKNYAVLPNREYPEEELRKIRSYFDLLKESKDFYIDDITWNDLDMDSIFIAMNHTFSSAGEEKLYDMLRTPGFSVEELKKREELISYFMENKEVREKLSVEFARIGRTRKYAACQYLNHFHDLTLSKTMRHAIHLILLVLSAVLIAFLPLPGIFVFLGVMGYNIYTYYARKGKVEAYYQSLAAMVYIVEAAKKISDIRDEKLAPYTKILKQEMKPVLSLTRNMSFLGSKQNSNASADLPQIILDYVRMSTHLDFIVFNKMVKVVQKNEDHLMKLMDTVGFLEAMIAIGSYRKTVPFYVTPEFSEEKKAFLQLEDAYHPLLSKPVANSIETEKSVLLTGSNASGKSTFLRTVAISSLMAQTVHTVHARKYVGSFYRLFSSMAISDDVQSGDSYYIAEIKSLKRIMDAKNGDTPVLAFIDEILRGTNTVERISASAEILKDLSMSNTLIFAATHDIELTHMLEDRYDNYHFRENVEDGLLWFTYILYKGRAETRNAIRLLSIMGYDEAVVENAENTAKTFLKEGVWPKM